METNNKGIVLLVFLAGIICSCKQSTPKHKVERLSLTPVRVISDSIESRLPGEMYLSNHYLLWTDPFNTEQFVHIIDITTGEEVGKMVQRGEGPEEFISPKIEIMPNDQVFVYDSFADRCAIFSIDSCINGKDPIVERKKNETKDVTSVVCMADGEVIVFSPSQNEPFILLGGKQAFGKLPFKGSISNSYDHFQGIIKYNPYNEHIYYSTFKIPYFALYKKENGNFRLKTEELRSRDCAIKDNNLIYTGDKRGPIGVTLTSDYIVTIDTDPKSESVDYFKIGYDYAKLPQSLCLYDYDLQLRKVIQVGMPIVRITSSPENNTLFLLSVNPDFILYQIEL